MGENRRVKMVTLAQYFLVPVGDLFVLRMFGMTHALRRA